jgi:glycosyltransferase involved in cell wall biosynthesis
MEPRPTVTALLPVYNGAATLRRALDSIFSGQSLPEEVLAVDDGSSDATAHILKAYELAQPNLRVVTLPANGGLHAALNLGVTQASGDFIARIDADDEWLEGHLAALRRQIDRTPGLKLASTGYAEQRASQRDPPRMPGAFSDFIRDNFIAHSSVLIHRQSLLAIGGYQEAVFEDYATWLALVDAPAEYAAIGEATVVIHILEGSLSRMARGPSLRLRYTLQRLAWTKYRHFLSLAERFYLGGFLAACRLRTLIV